MNCKNCDAVIDGNFCAHCGQKAEVHRITVGHVLHDLVHAFTHADKGIFRLAKQLLLKPGVVAREYVEGKRKRYFNPLSFLVLTMAISAWLSYKSGYFESMSRPRKPATAQIGKKVETEVDKVRQEASRINIEDHKIIGLALMAPLIAFLSWILFKGSGFTFAENFVLASFMFGLANLFKIFVFIPLHLLVPGKTILIDGIFQLVFLVYVGISFKQFFRSNTGLTVVKSVAFLILFIALFWVFMYSYAFVKISLEDLLA